MNDQYLEPKTWEEQNPEQPRNFRHVEPDWAESEWFQVWLELARQPHQMATAELKATDLVGSR
jgi:hypothetical protein